MSKLSNIVKKAILHTTAVKMWPATIVTSGSRTGFTRVKFSNSLEMDVLNYRIASIPNLKISVGYDPMMPGELQVLGIRESLRYLGENSAYLYFLPDHHKNHEYPNHDVVWVQGAQFIPNNVLPKGNNLEIQVYGSVLRTASNWVAVRSTTMDLTTHVPAAGARYVLIEMDDDGIPIATAGTAKTLPQLAVADIPAPTAGRLPVAAVLLRANQTTIERDVRSGHRNDIIDLRWSGYASGGSVATFDHEDLTGLLGGAPDDHYHLTTAEKALINTAYYTWVIGGGGMAYFKVLTAGIMLPLSVGDLYWMDGDTPYWTVVGWGTNFRITRGDSDATTLGVDFYYDPVVPANDYIKFYSATVDVLRMSSSQVTAYKPLVGVEGMNIPTGQTYKINGAPHTHDYAPSSEGVTNGDSHDHADGDGAQIPTGGLVDDAVTYAKMQNVSATDKLLGRATAGAGDVEEIACTAAGRALLDDANAAEQVATLGLVAGWIEVSATWTRTGNHTFTISGDVTTTYRKGTKVRYKDGGAFEYGVVISSAYSAPNTTVTLATNDDYAMAAGALTDTAISYTEAPEGYPHWFNYTPTFSASGSMTYTSITITTAKFQVIGTTVNVIVDAVGTTGGTANNTIYASPPIPDDGSLAPITCAYRDATTGQAPVGTGGINASGLFTRRADIANFGLNTGRIFRINGFYIMA